MTVARPLQKKITEWDEYTGRFAAVKQDGLGAALDVLVAEIARIEQHGFTESELDATILQQIADALKRIDNGTFGQCAVDGGAIEAKRLDAMPLTPYCVKHQQLREEAGRQTPATL